MGKELSKRIFSSAIILLFITLVIIQGSIFFNLLLFICFCVSLYEWYKLIKNRLFCYLGILFLIYSFYTAYKLYNFDSNYVNFIFVLLICISSDVGGYIFGKIFKGPKLISISPNKTYAGVFGALILTIISIFLFIKWLNLFPEELSISYKVFLFGILISIISQLGDLIISYFKRLYKIKNTGNILPGHGGILDRVDGMIFAFPFYYMLISNNLFKIY